MPPWSARIEPRRDSGFRAGGTDGRARWGRAVSEGLLSAADQIPRARYALPYALHRCFDLVRFPIRVLGYESVHDTFHLLGQSR